MAMTALEKFGYFSPNKEEDALSKLFDISNKPLDCDSCKQHITRWNTRVLPCIKCPANSAPAAPAPGSGNATDIRSSSSKTLSVKDKLSDHGPSSSPSRKTVENLILRNARAIRVQKNLCLDFEKYRFFHFNSVCDYMRHYRETLSNPAIVKQQQVIIQKNNKQGYCGHCSTGNVQVDIMRQCTCPGGPPKPGVNYDNNGSVLSIVKQLETPPYSLQQLKQHTCGTPCHGGLELQPAYMPKPVKNETSLSERMYTKFFHEGIFNGCITPGSLSQKVSKESAKLAMETHKMAREYLDKNKVTKDFAKASKESARISKESVKLSKDAIGIPTKKRREKSSKQTGNNSEENKDAEKLEQQKQIQQLQDRRSCSSALPSYKETTFCVSMPLHDRRSKTTTDTTVIAQEHQKPEACKKHKLFKKTKLFLNAKSRGQPSHTKITPSNPVDPDAVSKASSTKLQVSAGPGRKSSVSKANVVPKRLATGSSFKIQQPAATGKSGGSVPAMCSPSVKQLNPAKVTKSEAYVQGGSQQRTNQIQLNQGRESPTNVLYTANAKLDIFSPDSSQNKKRLKFDSINRGIAKKNKTQNSQQQQGRQRNDSRLTEADMNKVDSNYSTNKAMDEGQMSLRKNYMTLKRFNETCTRQKSAYSKVNTDVTSKQSIQTLKSMLYHLESRTGEEANSKLQQQLCPPEETALTSKILNNQLRPKVPQAAIPHAKRRQFNACIVSTDNRIIQLKNKAS